MTSTLYQEYGDMQELCELEYVSFHYKLPVVAEEVLELVPVQYPEPEEECLEVETAKIETECRDKEDNHCVSCAHIRSSHQESSADQVHQTNYGNCEERELSLPQTRCVLYCTYCTMLYCAVSDVFGSRGSRRWGRVKDQDQSTEDREVILPPSQPSSERYTVYLFI